MKTVLCISPNFPPVNAPDMQRLRQSVAYFEEFDWKPVIFCVKPAYIENSQDKLLLNSIPVDIEIHKVNAFSTAWTRKLGLGNLGFRSWLQYCRAVDQYLKHNKVDLVYFSTTVFTLMSLGLHWKKKFGVPFIVDLQDPWRNDYYLDVPRKNRPKKFWFDYFQKKYLEAKTMPQTGGIVAVSDGYIDSMKTRYPNLKNLKCLTLPFSALELDFEIAKSQDSVSLNPEMINIVYIGRGGRDMELSLSALFFAFKKGLDNNLKDFGKIRFNFFGTSYAADGLGEKTILPIAKKYSVETYVTEITDRVPFYKSLRTLEQADILCIPGSIDSNYTASKIFPYILAKKPLIAVFNRNSSVVDILKKTNGGEIVTFSEDSNVDTLSNNVLKVLKEIVDKVPFIPSVNIDAFDAYSAREMTKQQCSYFDTVLQQS